MQEDNEFETNLGYRPDCVTDSDPISKIKSKQQKKNGVELEHSSGAEGTPKHVYGLEFSP